MNTIGTDVAILTATVGFGFAAWTYPSYADRRSWTMEPWFRDRTWLIRTFALLGMASTQAIALILMPWWAALIVILGGILAGLLTIWVFKTGTQIIAPLGLVAGWITSLLYVIP